MSADDDVQDQSRPPEGREQQPGGARPAGGALSGGPLLAEITNRIVSLMRKHYGRGPLKAKTYVLDDLIVCVLKDGVTAMEQTLLDAGEPGRVVELRQDFQRLMETRYRDMVENLTGRKVLAFLSQAHVDHELSVEMFRMDGPVPGFGASQLVHPAKGSRIRSIACIAPDEPGTTSPGTDCGVTSTPSTSAASHRPRVPRQPEITTRAGVHTNHSVSRPPPGCAGDGEQRRHQAETSSAVRSVRPEP